MCRRASWLPLSSNEAPCIRWSAPEVQRQCLGELPGARACRPPNMRPVHQHAHHHYASAAACRQTPMQPGGSCSVPCAPYLNGAATAVCQWQDGSGLITRRCANITAGGCTANIHPACGAFKMHAADSSLTGNGACPCPAAERPYYCLARGAAVGSEQPMAAALSCLWLHVLCVRWESGSMRSRQSERRLGEV